MDTSTIQSPVVKPHKKLCFIHVAATLVIVIIVVMSYLLGQSTSAQCTNSVLGAQTPSSLVSRLALLFNISNERRIVPATENIQFVPAAESPAIQFTVEPTEAANDDEPTMIWAGSNRDVNATPRPTAIVPTTNPESFDINENTNRKQTPTPTIQYKSVGGRYSSTPTPAPVDVAPEQEKDSLDSSDDSKKPSKGMPTPTPMRETLQPDQIQEIIDLAGIPLVKPEMKTNLESTGISVTGAMKDTLFGIFPISYPVTMNINEESGAIENISIPWWRTLFGNPFTGNISQIRCGDGICSSTERYDTCASDCTPICGNGMCEYGEGQDTCAFDCGEVPIPEPTSFQ